ncbi:MAG: hypothetical protein LBI43_02820 [Streptococcaceae bacterium]|jgi:hypothetical protein|nr:hypothetical protein [Streptococcaceae bacterium]
MTSSASLLQRPPKQYWETDFKRSDPLYLLDGAIVRYPEAGILYEHHLIRDNMCIIELPQARFYGLPVGEKMTVTLASEDDGLWSFPEVKFFKAYKAIASFYDLEKKSTTFTVPAYDDFLVRIHVRGNGTTHLKSVLADVVK